MEIRVFRSAEGGLFSLNKDNQLSLGWSVVYIESTRLWVSKGRASGACSL